MLIVRVSQLAHSHSSPSPDTLTLLGQRASISFNCFVLNKYIMMAHLHHPKSSL